MSWQRREKRLAGIGSSSTPGHRTLDLDPTCAMSGHTPPPGIPQSITGDRERGTTRTIGTLQMQRGALAGEQPGSSSPANPQFRPHQQRTRALREGVAMIECMRLIIGEVGTREREREGDTGTMTSARALSASILSRTRGINGNGGRQ